ncbi:hypothetical protein CAPTEDRAFT_222145 [Capitella teleta]|uniref:Major facilitator superfamily (MFS) profile domain-containing protein n=1 Tax=Capitella teleta TaxID=283909 RepID=R7VF37_CAPTE|nr:hypothetical protein CAPTEDRAFT_222145 [Capitella teleta]|eukprot:ELU17167.1 hypothetical protein CAPTEDRAFT_222145 [Capitella teleta]
MDKKTAKENELKVIDPKKLDSSAAPKEFEDLIDSLGSFGHWQRVIFVLISAADVFGAFAMMLPVFTGATPNWSCRQFRHGNIYMNGSEVNNDTSEICEYKTTTDTNFHCSEFAFDGDFTSVVTEWNLVCGVSYVKNLINVIQMVGLTLGALCFGQMSDLAGRKKPYFLAYSFLIFSGFGSAFATSWKVYAFCRFLVGLGFGALMVVNCVFPLEFVGRRWRTVCGTVGFWAIGQLVLALMANYIKHWRYLTMASSISVKVMCFFSFIPESPRWLIQQGRYEEAGEILENIARKNNRPRPDFSQIVQVAKDERAQEATTRRFSTFLIYYELAYNMSALSGNRYVNMVYAGLVDLVAMLSVIPLNNTIGRRCSIVLFVTLALVGNVVLLGIYTAHKENEEGAPAAILLFTLLGKSAALAGTYVMQIYCAELYPTVIRNLGVGAGSVAARIGGIVAPSLVFLGTYNVTVPYIVSSSLCVVMLPLVWQLQETKDRALQDAL